MAKLLKTAILATLLAVLPLEASSAKLNRIKSGSTYKEGDPVKVIVNKIGPYNNPTETYRYYSFPFCSEHASKEEQLEAAKKEQKEDAEVTASRGSTPLGGQRHKQRFGESIVGHRLESSPYDIKFKENVDWRLLCKKKLSPAEVSKIKDAIHNIYFFEMFIEDLPMWGYIGDVDNEDIIIGETENSHTYLFPHLKFHIGHNKDQIVAVNVTTDPTRRVDITDDNEPKEVEFSYSVEFKEFELPWSKRMTSYHASRFLPGSFEIHWLSIINSFVLVLLLTAFLTIILLRVLKNDFSRYMELDDDALEEEESGWKLIHGDVFRFPTNTRLFCAALGVGNQLIVLTFCHLCLALSGVISTTRRGSLLAGVVVLYCLTSVVAGYSSVRMYRKMNGKNWVQCVLLTASLFPAPVVLVFMWVNTLAIFRGSTSALPFTAILTITALYVLLAFPLTVVGGILAKNYASADFGAPTRTTKVAREIPTEVPWYRGRPFQILIAGFLPFSAIYIELHYIFASMWGHKIYTLFGILMLAFVLLIIVTSFITVALLYFQLAREDHRWWWAAYTNGGMTGIFIYLYSFYYFFHRSDMSGLLQTSFYFGYMAVVSFAFFLMLGSAGFQFSLLFVKYIYSRVKCD